MSIQEEIARIQGAKEKLKAKAIALKIVTGEGDKKIQELANAYDGIENKGSVSATVEVGNTYTIPKGYHDGTGTVTGQDTGAGEKYKLQSKTATPTTSRQEITPDEGYYGLSDVAVEAIPANFKDVSATTATVPDVLATKVFINSRGEQVTGNMPNIGAVSQKLKVGTASYTVPKGYHNGEGIISIDLEEKTVTPNKSRQEITPTENKVLSKVTVKAIPENYVDTADANAGAGDILTGKTAYVNGAKVTGTMANLGSVAGEINALAEDPSKTIGAGYTTGGKITIGNQLLQALQGI